VPLAFEIGNHTIPAGSYTFESAVVAEVGEPGTNVGHRLHRSQEQGELQSEAQDQIEK
jgi:hypothetical protein